MKKFLAMTAAALLATTTLASAATLSLIGTGGTSVTLGGTFNPSPAVSGPGLALGSGSVITAYSGAILTGGLAVSGATSVLVTYIASQTPATNTVTNFTNFIFGAVPFLGSSISASTTGAGYVGLSFTNNNQSKTANNAVSTDTGASIAFSAIFNGGKSVYALFEDGNSADGVDYDDMIVRIDLVDIPEVPVPAAGLLLLSGLGGLGLMRRRKKA